MMLQRAKAFKYLPLVSRRKNVDSVEVNPVIQLKAFKDYWNEPFPSSSASPSSSNLIIYLVYLDGEEEMCIHVLSRKANIIRTFVCCNVLVAS
jgi:hypothetical protein